MASARAARAAAALRARPAHSWPPRAAAAAGRARPRCSTCEPGQCFVAPEGRQGRAEQSRPGALHQGRTPRRRTRWSPTRLRGAGPSASAAGGAYPGGDALDKFAKGACAQRFTAYVGVDYLDSKLFFTYLLPSARSWEQDNDRTILCFVTTTGGTLTASVKGSRK